jgi:hypothetical protein
LPILATDSVVPHPFAKRLLPHRTRIVAPPKYT